MHVNKFVLSNTQCTSVCELCIATVIVTVAVHCTVTFTHVQFKYIFRMGYVLSHLEPALYAHCETYN